MESDAAVAEAPRPWWWYAVWILVLVIAAGAAIAFGVHRANEEEAKRFDVASDADEGVASTRGTDSLVQPRIAPPPELTATPEMADTRSAPLSDAEGESVDVVLHYATDRGRIKSVWTLVKREFTLVGIAFAFALLFTLLYKRVVSAPLRPLRWPLYLVVWGVFLYALPSAVQGSWIAVQRYEGLGVWYGKDRTTDPAGYEVGTCTVTIPKNRQAGEVTEAVWWNGEWTPDPSKHFTMSALEPQTEDEFFASVKSRFPDAGPKSVLVFVHGYNNRFEHAAFRCAQIVHDLEYPGVAMFWSWPSRGEEEAVHGG